MQKPKHRNLGYGDSLAIEDCDGNVIATIRKGKGGHLLVTLQVGMKTVKIPRQPKVKPRLAYQEPSSVESDRLDN